MKRKNIVAANWKMNLTAQEGTLLLENILDQVKEIPNNNELVFGVPFPYLHQCSKVIGDKKNIFLAAQNCASEQSGAYTGETSISMIESVGGRDVILGHSERRQYFGETDSIVLKKIQLCLNQSLRPIYCCGEPLSERERGSQNQYVKKQLKDSILRLTEAEMSNVVIAYEPIWAIGTGKTATEKEAQEMHGFIRSLLAETFSPELSEKISILYGGSVKVANAKELFSQRDVDGGLIGGASLKADEFVPIIHAML